MDRRDLFLEGLRDDEQYSRFGWKECLMVVAGCVGLLLGFVLRAYCR